MTLGEFLRAKRQAKNISLRQMARRIACDSGNLSKIERGELEPSGRILMSYAKDLRLTQSESDRLFVLAGRLPPDIKPTVLLEKDVFRCVREGA